MPSDRKYYGVRLPEEEERALAALVEALRRRSGFELGYTDTFRRGLRLLADELGVEWPDPATMTTKTPRRPRGRPRKGGGA